MYLFQKTDQGFTIGQLPGKAYYQHILQPDGTKIEATQPIKTMLAGDLLLAYLELGRLVPIPRKIVFAEKTLNPELDFAKETIAEAIGVFNKNLTKFLDKVKNPKVLQADLEKTLQGVVDAKQTMANAQVENILPNITSFLQNMDPNVQVRVAKVHLGEVKDGSAKGVFTTTKLVTAAGTDTLLARLDSGSEICLISPKEVERLNPPTVGQIVLSGIERGQYVTKTVGLDVVIDNE